MIQQVNYYKGDFQDANALKNFCIMCDVVTFEVSIADAAITFTGAREWPELHGKRFSIQEDEGEWVPYFVTELGKVHIQAPSQWVRAGSPPDEMLFRTYMFRGWQNEDLKLQRRRNQANKLQ